MAAGQFSFELYRSNAAGAQLQLLQTKFNFSAGASSPVNFDRLRFTAAGDYYYLLKETASNEAGWTMDDTEYLIKVTVAGSSSSLTVASVTYSARHGGAGTFTSSQNYGNGANKPAFRNVFDGSPILPDTGGIGSRPFFITAMILTAALSMFLSGTLIYKHHRRGRTLHGR
jgi:pilin isopeptide linkage protein